MFDRSYLRSALSISSLATVGLISVPLFARYATAFIQVSVYSCCCLLRSFASVHSSTFVHAGSAFSVCNLFIFLVLADYVKRVVFDPVGPLIDLPPEQSNPDESDPDS